MRVATSLSAQMKRCSGCRRALPEGDFAPIKSNPGRRMAKCRECVSAYMRDWHEKHPGYSSEQTRRWIAGNVERWKELSGRSRGRPEPPRVAMETLRRTVLPATAEACGPRSDGIDKIYFVQEGDAGPVKIGWTRQGLVARLAQIQNGNPRPLRLIGVALADQAAEKDLHGHFAELHLHGEWFRPEPSLLAFVADVARVPDVPRRTNRVGYRGVTFNSAGRYVARIQVGKCARYLGTFDTPEEAAQAYDDEAKVQFGQGATLNFPDGGRAI